MAKLVKHLYHVSDATEKCSPYHQDVVSLNPEDTTAVQESINGHLPFMDLSNTSQTRASRTVRASCFLEDARVSFWLVAVV